MQDIPNTKYITVKQNPGQQPWDIGCYVGDKIATKYQKEKINLGYVMEAFAYLRQKNPNLTELHCGAFDRIGKFDDEPKICFPCGKSGLSAFCRVKCDNGMLGPWVFVSVFWCLNDLYYHVWDSVKQKNIQNLLFSGIDVGQSSVCVKNNNGCVVELPNLGVQIRIQVEKIR